MKKTPLYLILFLLLASFTMSGTYNMELSSGSFDLDLDPKKNTETNSESLQINSSQQNIEDQEKCKEVGNTYFKLISVEKSKSYWKTSNSWFVYF